MLAQQLTDDNVLDLLEGKKVNGIKFDKNLRREVKHAIKRQEDIDVLDILCRDGVTVNNVKLNNSSMTGKALYKNKGMIHARF